MSAHSHHLPDSRYAWTRLAITLVLISLGSSTMYVVPVVFPAVQADFGVDRAAVSASYAMLMVGMGVGGDREVPEGAAVEAAPQLVPADLALQQHEPGVGEHGRGEGGPPGQVRRRHPGHGGGVCIPLAGLQDLEVR